MRRVKEHWRAGSILFLFLFLFFSFPTAAMTAEFYKWKDKKGNVFFSDTPPPPDANADVIKFKPEPIQTIPKPKPQTNVNSPKGTTVKPDEKRSYSSISVILYSTSWCGYCRKAKAYLQNLNVNLVEYDVEKDPSKGKEMLIKSGGARGVPLIDVEGIIIPGFDETAIKQAVEKKRGT